MRKMTMHARREYLIQLKERYLKAGKAKKGWYLDEAEKITGMNRTYSHRKTNSVVLNKQEFYSPSLSKW